MISIKQYNVCFVLYKYNMIDRGMSMWNVSAHGLSVGIIM